MHQRLLFTLSVLLISAACLSQNVMTPTDICFKYNKDSALGSTANPRIPFPGNQVAKWVHDPSQNGAGRSDTIGSYGFDQSTFKCYRYGNTSYRIRFPNNYDPANAAKYPLILFLHGAGEAAKVTKTNNNGANRENQDQLYWGAQLFEQRMNQGQWNGFLLFPQVMDASAQWNSSNPAFYDITNVLDTLQKYNAFDPDRLLTMGLSAGGIGAINYAQTYPQRVATIISANPKFINDATFGGLNKNYLQVPIWEAFGGLDDAPSPGEVQKFIDSVRFYGGNVYSTYNGSEGHVSWKRQYAQQDASGSTILTKFWNAAHKAQPLLYYQKADFCNGSPIKAKMGITAGFAAYEWQYDDGSGFVSIPGGTLDTITVTKAGKYRVHFKRSAAGNWSAWTPSPIVITSKACSADTAFVEHFQTTPVNSYTAHTEYQLTYACQNGIVADGTEGFSQDASGRMGGHFMIHNTESGCTYPAGDWVWRTNNFIPVTANTNYTFSFYMGNQTTGNKGDNPATPLTRLTVKINNTVLTSALAETVSTGDVSWKKYTFLWYSGSETGAQPYLINNTSSSTGNDFVIDEISLVKSNGILPVPGAAFSNVALWAKANSLPNQDGTGVGVWSNSNINGNGLGQSSSTSIPVFKNNAASNINFNPIVNFNSAGGQYLQEGQQSTTGLSGTGVHSAVTAYIVAKFNNLGQNNRDVISESQASGRSVRVTTHGNAVLSWTAGSDPANTVTTPDFTVEQDKAAVWTFNKDNAGTASGTAGVTQDIRKNGLVVATGTGTGTYTGNNSVFKVSNNTSSRFFSGDVAEVIYVVDSTMTPSKQSRIESYLALKYGTTLGSATTPVNYTASNGTVFWTGDVNFQSDVFGIGTDSASGLVQTISNAINTGSGDGTGQAGRANIVLSTNTPLLDKRFLVIGNDQNPLTRMTIPAGKPLAGSIRVGRSWKAQNTGSVGAVTISFDTSGIKVPADGSALNGFALMISDAGDRSYPTVRTVTANASSGSRIIFPNVTLPSGSVFTVVTNTFIALPAVWLGFTAEAVNGDGLLKWKTSDEINVARYSVEHSFNGISFSPVGTVAANNYSGENNYSFVHPGLAAGTHYYRIRRTDKDGKSELSETRSIKITMAGANVQVRPNPVVGSTLVLAVSLQQANKTNIQVTGVDGKLIMQQAFNLSTGTNTVNINIANVPPGIYLVRVQLADEVVTKKFVKQR